MVYVLIRWKTKQKPIEACIIFWSSAQLSYRWWVVACLSLWPWYNCTGWLSCQTPAYLPFRRLSIFHHTLSTSHTNSTFECWLIYARQKNKNKTKNPCRTNVCLPFRCPSTPPLSKKRSISEGTVTVRITRCKMHVHRAASAVLWALHGLHVFPVCCLTKGKVAQNCLECALWPRSSCFFW